MISWHTHETHDELEIPKPPQVPREHKGTVPTRANPDWTEIAPGEMYCTKHSNYWTLRRGTCYGCRDEREDAAMKASSSHESPDMRPVREVRITDPKTGGQKGQKEERFDLIPWDAMRQVAEVYGKGASKYADRNWEKGYSWGLSIGAMARHFALWCMGETFDKETGCDHMAHCAWHALTLITFRTRKVGTDDRVKT